MDDHQRPTWYAVHTNARKEPLVDRLLKRQGFDTLFLHFTAVVKHAKKTHQVIRPYFNRYIFAGVNSGQALWDINHTIGVSTIVYRGDEPLKIPAPVIEELRARGNTKGLVKLAPEQIAGYRKRFRQGEQVRISDGPLAGLLAVVALDKGHEVRVWLEMFKGRVEAALQPEALSPARRS